MRKKRILVVVLFLLVSLFGLYQYIYKDHRDISSESTDIIIGGTQLKDAFVFNYSKANVNYLDKTILVTGKITELTVSEITLDNVIFCTFDTIVSTINLNDSVMIKGRCIGFDELLEQVKVDQCQILKK
ncbi:hypothetical protein KH5_22760 [Urechidicola sp. KH5]